MRPAYRFQYLAVAAALVFASQQASATAIFSDDFEGGLIASNWETIGHGQIVVDPLNASNHVLTFSQLASGGDIFSVPLNLNVGLITLSFDYLGIQPTGGNGTDTGGFVIFEFPNSVFGSVLAGTSSAGAPKIPDMLNLTPGVWHHISATFASSLVGAGNGSDLVLEQWSGSSNPAGNAYFDNIQVSSSPEPGSVWLIAAGMSIAILVRPRLRA
jgi:hypothetical protein